MVRVIGVALLAGVAGAGNAAPSQNLNLFERLSVGAHVHFPDGRRVSTWRTFDKMGQASSTNELYSTRSLCVFTDKHQDPKTHGYGWRFEVTPMNDNGTRATVKVQWSRSRYDGTDVAEPKGSAVINLMPGQSVPLDFIVPAPTDTSGCEAVGMMLDVSVKALGR